MDDGRFDAVARWLGAVADRRRGLKGAVAALAGLGAGAALAGGPAGATEVAPETCRDDGRRCEKNGDCCGNLKCKRTGNGNKRRCQGKVAVPVCAGTYDAFDTFGAVPSAGIAVTGGGSVWFGDERANELIRCEFPNCGLRAPGVPDGAPGGMAIGPGGNLYVADSRITEVYSVEPVLGHMVSNPWAITADDYFIAFDTSGNMYSTSIDYHRVSKYDNTGALLGTWDICTTPLGVAIGPGEHVYVACYDEGGVTAYDKNSGAALFSFGTPDTAATAFDLLKSPLNLAFVGNAAYVGVVKGKSGYVAKVAVDEVAKTGTVECRLPSPGKSGAVLGMAHDPSNGTVVLGLPYRRKLLRWTPGA